MLDYLEIFKTFNQRNIKYIIVGGVAINLHGMTYDIDLLLDMTDANIKLFIDLMKEWGFKPRVPVSIDDFINKDKRREWVQNKNMKAFTLINPDWAISEIDVIIDSPIDYKKVSENSVKLKVNDVLLPVISIDDLIEMKKETGRTHDQIDIEYLQRLKDATRKNR